jgi:LysR family transcriptional regulator, glycine cleavage system transcriptional activator
LDINDINRASDLSFREELHAIDAVVAGQGIAICSDVVISHELRCGKLIKVHALSLPGYGFYLVHLPHHPREPIIQAFSTWARSAI